MKGNTSPLTPEIKKGLRYFQMELSQDLVDELVVMPTIKDAANKLTWLISYNVESKDVRLCNYDVIPWYLKALKLLGYGKAARIIGEKLAKVKIETMDQGMIMMKTPYDEKLNYRLKGCKHIKQQWIPEQKARKISFNITDKAKWLQGRIELFDVLSECFPGHIILTDKLVTTLHEIEDCPGCKGKGCRYCKGKGVMTLEEACLLSDHLSGAP